jgi:dihydrofolate reductase
VDDHSQSDAAGESGGEPFGRVDPSERADPDREVVLIVAVDPAGVIGADGGIPWDLPEDMAHFERTTTGNPVVLGRRTYESIAAQVGGPLPNRTNVVLSRGEPDLAADALVVDSVPAALRAADDAPSADDRIFVAGGATVYEQCLPVADTMLRSEVHDRHEGDTRFPPWDRDRWAETDRAEHEGFDVVTYRSE